MAYALEIEEKLLEHVKNAQSAFSEFGRAIAKIEPIELIKEYMVAFGSVEPLNGKSAPPLMLTRSRITPTSIVLFDNKDFKLSLRELNNSDKIVASNCCWSIFPLKNTSLNLYSLPTNLKSKDDE